MTTANSLIIFLGGHAGAVGAYLACGIDEGMEKTIHKAVAMAQAYHTDGFFDVHFAADANPESYLARQRPKLWATVQAAVRRKLRQPDGSLVTVKLHT